jgi:endogenous inhibitor of DNA gyrase (YacG/DUF329 family)
VDSAWKPFCSERCKMADLGRWLSEDYRVPDEGQPDGPGDHQNGRRRGDDADDTE